MANPFAPTSLTEAQFHKISELVKRLAGINLHVGKMQLVKARLNKRLRDLGMTSFAQYLAFLEDDKSGNELVSMLDALSTNLTNFFREPTHFDYLRTTILPRILQSGKSRRIRVWSAGCSTGEEPYTICITLLETIPNMGLWDVKILATDLSTQVLKRAAQGVYSEARFEGVPRAVVHKYFDKVKSDGPETNYQVKGVLRQLVTFGRLNLMEAWPMTGPFDVIFCRNVMIYFEKPTQAKLIQRYYDLLCPGGVFFLGHSESLTGTNHRFKYIQPTIYEK
ncbi:MAG: protein-glutamate O-methyltransferase CheR [Candidatus Eisenbacteria sp.]|nr:protein-glutamate O-methyltransferase CheR [Candidatus Eisenbacteria bacterium]